MYAIPQDTVKFVNTVIGMAEPAGLINYRISACNYCKTNVEIYVKPSTPINNINVILVVDDNKKTNVDDVKNKRNKKKEETLKPKIPQNEKDVEGLEYITED